MKNCKQCNIEFDVTPEDLDFYDRVSPVIGGKKINIPEPTLCPDCRMQRRMVWRNERSLYRNTCSQSGESLISWFSPDKPYKILKKDLWWGDSWDGKDSSKDFDFSRPFFEQFDELLQSVPWMDLLVDEMLNSPYANYCYNNKDCHLIYASNNNESCYYSNSIVSCKDCVNCFQIFDSELCYGSVDTTNSYKVNYSKNCDNCSEIFFCENCRNCKNCFGCVNMVGKEYCFMNQQLDKEQYLEKLKGLNLGSYSRISEARSFFIKHRLQFPMRYAQVIGCENVTGDNIKDSKNVVEGYDTKKAEDCKWVYLSDSIKDVYDGSGCEDVEFSYEVCVHGVPGRNCYFSAYVWKNVSDVLYSVLCPSCHDCFGCASLKKEKYCILNKQYTKEEYEELVPKIIEHMKTTGEWGEYFPVSISPFSYNETVAQDYFPLKKEEVASNGWKWFSQTDKDHKPSNFNIPDNIDDVNDEILNNVLSCKTCSKNFKLIPQELKFYKNHNIPIPQKCPDCRLDKLIDMRNPKKLHHRRCDKCSSPIQTTYSTDKPEKVYCEECFLKEVY